MAFYRRCSGIKKPGVCFAHGTPDLDNRFSGIYKATASITDLRLSLFLVNRSSEEDISRAIVMLMLVIDVYPGKRDLDWLLKRRTFVCNWSLSLEQLVHAAKAPS